MSPQSAHSALEVLLRAPAAHPERSSASGPAPELLLVHARLETRACWWPGGQAAPPLLEQLGLATGWSLEGESTFAPGPSARDVSGIWLAPRASPAAPPQLHLGLGHHHGMLGLRPTGLQRWIRRHLPEGQVLPLSPVQARQLAFSLRYARLGAGPDELLREIEEVLGSAPAALPWAHGASQDHSL